MAGIFDLLNGADNGTLGGIVGGPDSTMTPEEAQVRLQQANAMATNPMAWASNIDQSKVGLGGIGLAAGLAQLLSGNIARNRIGSAQVGAQKDQAANTQAAEGPTVAALSSGAGQAAASGNDYRTMALKLIEGNEGFKSNAYRDGAQNSIGYGSKADSMGQTVTPQQAEGMASSTLQKLDATIGAAVPQYQQLSPPQKAALLDAAYNLGAGAITGNTSLHRDLASGNMPQLAQDLTKYNHDSNGNVLPGLDKRRHQEAALLTAAQAPGGATDAPMPQGNSIAHTAQLGVDPAALTRMNANTMVPQAYKDAMRDRLQSETTPKDIATPQGIQQVANTGQTGFVPNTQFVSQPTTTMAPGPEGGATVGGVTGAEGGTGFGPESTFGKMQQDQARSTAAAGVAGQVEGSPKLSLEENQTNAKNEIARGNESAARYADIRNLTDISDLAGGLRGESFDQTTELGKKITALFQLAGAPPPKNATYQGALQALNNLTKTRMMSEQADKLGGVAGMVSAGFDPGKNTPEVNRSVADYMKQTLDVDMKMKDLANEALTTKDPAKLAQLANKRQELQQSIVMNHIDDAGNKVSMKDYVAQNKPGGSAWNKKNEGALVRDRRTGAVRKIINGVPTPVSGTDGQ